MSLAFASVSIPTAAGVYNLWQNKGARVPLEIDDNRVKSSLVGTARTASTTRLRKTTDTRVIGNRKGGVSSEWAGNSAAEKPAVVS